jgi:hypothetical protein
VNPGHLALERLYRLRCDQSRDKPRFAGGRQYARKPLGADLLGAVCRHGDRGECVAIWRPRARYVGRVAVGMLMLLGGAVFNAVNLALGDYAGFADQAHFGWVTAAWRAIVAPNQYLFIGLLVAFEAVVGVLILSGGRRAQLGLIGAIGFHVALWLFGWFVTIYCLIMLPALVLLLRAERRAATIDAATAAPAAVSSVGVTSRKG